MLRPLSLLPVLLLLAAAAAAACEEEEVLPEEVGQAQETTATAGPTPEATPTPSPQPTAEPTAAPTPTPSPAPTPESPSVDTSGWLTYEDPIEGFVLIHPVGPAPAEDIVRSPEKMGLPAVDVRTLVFRNTKGVFAVGIAIAPNPAGLSLEQWIETYPGWPGQPSEIEIAGQRALLFPIDQVGEAFPQIYFQHNGSVYTIQANVHGSGGAPPAMTSEEFDRMITEFRFEPQ